jgi:cell division protein ZapA
MANVKVEIFGNEYSIKITDESQIQYIKEISRYVDQKMKEISQKTSIVSIPKLTILTALNIADEYFMLKNQKMKEEKKNLEKIDEIIKLLDEAIK